MRLTGSSAFFVIRAKPGQATALLRRVPEALKAASKRRDILVYFLTENGLISLAGAAVGIVLSFALNQWMSRASKPRACRSCTWCGGDDDPPPGAAGGAVAGEAGVPRPAVERPAAPERPRRSAQSRDISRDSDNRRQEHRARRALLHGVRAGYLRCASFRP